MFVIDGDHDELWMRIVCSTARTINGRVEKFKGHAVSIYTNPGNIDNAVVAREAKFAKSHKGVYAASRGRYLKKKKYKA